VESSKVYRLIEGQQREMVETLSRMIGIKSISPESGGSGEMERALFLEKVLKNIGVAYRRYDYKDSAGVTRPSLIAKFGSCRRTLWIIAHIDTVSEGDRSEWDGDPFKARVSNGKIFGRGSMDNGQGVVSAIYALGALKESKAEMKYNIGIALVADEEMGSTYGLSKVIDEGVFKKCDIFLVPDGGNAEGNEIEVAEKGILWLKFTVSGKQTHASTPDNGINAFRYSSELINKLDEHLHKKYNKENMLFTPSRSTFEMTKHEANVDSINIIPGKEIFYLDCRILPNYRIDDIIRDVKRIASGNEFRKVKISVEIPHREDPSRPTSPDSEVVKVLMASLKELRGIRPKAIGVGGGTCAVLTRKKGFQTVVWATLTGHPHEPNEFCMIKDMVADTKVFASICLSSQ
jgi:succinyl-diaminopimelate desuccinylase